MQIHSKRFILLTLLIAICSVALFIQILKTDSRRIVVCIDPGHGGYDVGAQAADGTNEKDLTLAYAKEIGKYLYFYNPHIKIIYTRTSDEVIWPNNEQQDLAARVQYARVQQADYYLSIHFNTASKKSAYGYTAYIKNTDSESKVIYENIVKSMDKIEWKYNRGLETTTHKTLYVVDRLDIPSMLMEVGFLTNENELNDLKKTSNRKKVSKAIARGYAEYLKTVDQ